MISALATLCAVVLAADAPAPGAPGADAPAAAEAPAAAPGEGEFEAEYIHSLSTNFGRLPLSGAGLSYDPAYREVYVTGNGPVRVFNDSGMEVYRFSDLELGTVYSIGAMEDGLLVALVSRGGRPTLVRCNFRGEVVGELVPRNVPERLAGFVPSGMRYADHRIYLVDSAAMQVLVLDETGAYLAWYDVAEKLEAADKRHELGIRGFGVDAEGNILFTVQPLFRAYVMTPAGEVRGFGQRGSAPGKFNIVGGIARDVAGNLYVADLLKSAILVFGPDYEFVKEFGYRGASPGSLAAPDEIVVGGEKLFVSNRARRGVSVFHIGSR